MNEKLEINPGESIGPYKLGMSRNEVWSCYRYPITCFYKTDKSKFRTDSIELLGIHVHYDEDEKCNFIELWFPIKYNSPVGLLQGIEVTGMNMSDVATLIDMLGINATKDTYGFESKESGIGFYCHNYDDEQSKLDGVYISNANSKNS